ncbi:hypothetical protein ABZX93_05865 [Streptomyces sp. NPDC006632]|uniref:hypothetical protein n=1 Tax=Streptomyces sp. NPDC006632 TaxID=3157182 RepID=UPI0033AD4812
MTVPLLMVPSVPDGDQGLVLEVNGVASEPQSRRWYVVTTDGNTFRLPVKLWPWAMELDARTRRRELRMPAVFAFRLVGETVTADIISRV